MPATPEDMAAAMVANVQEKAGKTHEQWLAIAKKAPRNTANRQGAEN